MTRAAKKPERKLGKRQLTPFGKAVKKRLIDLDMTFYDLQEKIGIHRNYITALLCNHEARSYYIPQICKVLGLDFEEWVA